MGNKYATGKFGRTDSQRFQLGVSHHQEHNTLKMACVIHENLNVVLNQWRVLTNGGAYKFQGYATTVANIVQMLFRLRSIFKMRRLSNRILSRSCFNLILDYAVTCLFAGCLNSSLL